MNAHVPAFVWTDVFLSLGYVRWIDCWVTGKVHVKLCKKLPNCLCHLTFPPCIWVRFFLSLPTIVTVIFLYYSHPWDLFYGLAHGLPWRMFPVLVRTRILQSPDGVSYSCPRAQWVGSAPQVCQDLADLLSRRPFTFNAVTDVVGFTPVILLFVFYRSSFLFVPLLFIDCLLFC